MHTVATAVAVLAALHMASAAGMYSKGSPVLQINADTYDRVIAHSNHTAIVEFYAPWCGHCQNLKPAYEKAARNLDGLAKVAAVDCDDDANKALCGRMGIQGFPTLKIVRPSKKAVGRPVVQDYQGPRTATGIVEAVIGSMNNHVAKVTDADIDDFLGTAPETPKALLFTDKGATTPLLKSIAIDFLGVITIGQVRNKEAQTVARFGVTSFPTLVLLPGGNGEGDPAETAIVYDGELKKDAIVKFLSQAGAPNPDSAPSSSAGQKKREEKKTKKEKKTKAATSADAEDASSSTTSTPTEQQTAPVMVDSALPIPTLHTAEKLKKECLNEKAHTCVLAFTPETSKGEAISAEGQAVLDSLAEVAFKYAHGKRRLFPIRAVPVNDETALMVADLGLDTGNGAVQLVAVNVRRGWWRRYEGPAGASAVSAHEAIEAWIDSIRMGEGEKKALPAGLVVASAEEAEAEAEAEPAEPSETSTTSEAAEPSETSTESEPAEPSSTEASEAASETPEAEADEIKHEEL